MPGGGGKKWGGGSEKGGGEGTVESARGGGERSRETLTGILSEGRKGVVPAHSRPQKKKGEKRDRHRQKERKWLAGCASATFKATWKTGLGVLHSSKDVRKEAVPCVRKEEKRPHMAYRGAEVGYGKE